jgi:cyclopropane fatty-acyl-phospholipid synthase-like methyltransferase
MLTIVEKTWNEFWAYYWRVTSRHAIPGIQEWDQRLVDLIEKSCSLAPAMRILDLGCGGGDQARIFAKRGYSVVGIDIAKSLIEHAKKLFKDNSLSGTFISDDMRNIEYSSEFDLCVLLSGTFGFFSDEGNLQLLKKIHRALKPNGKIFIMYLSPYKSLKKTRTWTEIKDGYELSETWFDMTTSTYQGTVRLIMHNGTVLVPKNEPGYHANEVIRCYTVPEMEGLLKSARFEDIKHLSRKHIDEPGISIEPGETRDIVVAKKG